MKTIRTILAILLLFAFLLSACSSPTAQPAAPVSGTAATNPGAAQPTAPQPNNQSAYPAPTYQVLGNRADPAYPAPTQIPDNPAYPGPQPTLNPGTFVQPVPFQINRPVKPGDTHVTGTGPADIPIALADVTLNGEIMGLTTIGADGKFDFKIDPLQAGHRIGVALGDLNGTHWVSRNFNDSGFLGQQPKTVPSVGFFFDTILVEK